LTEFDKVAEKCINCSGLANSRANLSEYMGYMTILNMNIQQVYFLEE